MSASTIHLPDGQTFTVQPVFGGLFFKSHELNRHHRHPFPIGWTIVIHTEDADADADARRANNNNNGDAMAVDPPAHHKRTTSASATPADDDDGDDDGDLAPSALGRPHPQPHPHAHHHTFTQPTLQRDALYIASLSTPSAADYRPPASPTRQIAMMLWVTLYWYFHQRPAPPRTLPPTEASRLTPAEGRPRGDWRVRVRRDGVLRGRNLLPKLERMGLVASPDSAVGGSSSPDDDAGAEWAGMYVSQRAFWQLPGRLFLFTLQPTNTSNGPGGSRPGSPASSRPGSPVAAPRHLVESSSSNSNNNNNNNNGGGSSPNQQQQGHVPTSPGDVPIGPFYSSSHLPTYYPPPPLQYTFSNGVRHPVRPKPPRMGEVFYTRYVPSVGQYLSFRVASSSPRPVPYLGPTTSSSSSSSSCGGGNSSNNNNDNNAHHHLTTMCDIVLVQRWLSNPRVARFWGGPAPNFLTSALASRHSFPAIGMWDGVPFGYFEIYWVREDALGRHLGDGAGDFDRGLHVFVGEEWARGRVQAWLGGLCHWIFCADNRTESVSLEPRVDNERFIQHLQDGGFVKEREITFPHKQSWFGRLRRENWDGPSL